MPTTDEIKTEPCGAINIDAEEIGVANTLQTRLSSAEEEARTTPSHEAKLGRLEAAPKAGVPLVAVGIDGSGLNTEVVLLDVAWEMLIEHRIGLGRAFFG